MKKLRKKFILVAMASMFVVLLLMIGGLNVLNYHNLIENGDRLTKMISDNGGSFPRDQKAQNAAPPVLPQGEKPGKAPRDGMGQQDGSKAPPYKNKPMTREEPYQTRYFTVTISSKETKVNVDQISAVQEDTAKAYMETVKKSGSDTGFVDIYRYRVVKQTDAVLYVFVDCEQSLSTYKNTLLISAGMSVAGFCIVFLLVCIFSRIIFKPVRESYQKQKQFITDASHELKTPLTIIEANTEVLEMDQGENQWLKSTHNQIERMSHLVQQMVSLTRMDEEGGKGEKCEFFLSDALLDQVELYEPQAHSRGIRIHPDVAPGIVYRGQEEEVRQLFGILFDNAMKYSTKDTEFVITLRRKNRRCRMTFTNETEQVVKGNQNILFERFYRSDASRNSATGGSGIGLAIARAICENHGGSIQAESKDGHSLTITVVL